MVLRSMLEGWNALSGSGCQETMRSIQLPRSSYLYAKRWRWLVTLPSS
jgi:hypothetical protein